LLLKRRHGLRACIPVLALALGILSYLVIIIPQ
jgi:hypothetical protein